MDRGLKILLNTYWCSKGWTNGDISEEDYEIAKREGYMFDYPEHISHEETLRRLRGICSTITPEQVAEAFLYSLSTRRLEYRSILATYWYALAIPDHTPYYENKCGYCRWYAWSKNPSKYDLKHGVNVLNFERYKWGGVRHTRLEYALFDLEQFKLLPSVKSTDEDKRILQEILNCVYELEPSNKAGKLRDLISKKKLMKTNKQEITVLLEILSICGVLSSERIPCYYDRFDVDTSPIEHTNDMEYPLNRWKAFDGVNQKRYEIVFGEKYKSLLHN